MKLKDLTNKKIGRWTVIDRDVSKKKVYWNCICECGTIKSVPASVLIDERSKSCGCLWKENISKTKTNIIGNKYGRFTVIDKGQRNGFWICECECGNIREIYISSLKAGSSQSCGCLRTELFSFELHLCFR